MPKYKHESAGWLMPAFDTVARGSLWAERNVIAQNLSPQEVRDALAQNLQAQGITVTQQQLDQIAAGTHGHINTLMQRQGNAQRQPMQSPQAVARNQVHPGESEEHAAERIAAGRSFEQQANQPHFSEAAMIGAGTLSALPAAAAAYATVPSLWAAGGIGPTAAFLAPAAVGAWGGKVLGDRLGHPVAGAAIGASAGVATGYGVLASAPYLAQGLTGIQTGMTAFAATNPYLLGLGGAGIGATLGAMIGRYTGVEHGGKIGAGIGGAIGLVPGVTGLAAPASLASVLSYAGPIGAFIAAPAALGAALGYNVIGGTKGATVGAIGGGLMGGSAWMLGANASAAAGVTSLVPAILSPMVAGVAAAGSTYAFGKFHKLLWGTDDQVGTWGMLARGAPGGVALGTAIALGGLTLPAVATGVAAAGGAMLGLRGLTAIHERLWNGTWNDSSASTTTRALRALFSPVTIPAGIVKHAWDGTIGAVFRGLKGDKYEPKFTSKWNPLTWTEKILSLPGRVLRGTASTGASAAKASTVGLWKHLWDDSKPLY